MPTIKLGRAVETDVALPLTVTYRQYLSLTHLYAARYAAEAAKEMESAGLPAPATVLAYVVQQRGHVLAAIMESVAFLEATINELFQDVTDGRESDEVEPLDPAVRSTMAAVWDATDNGQLGTLEKYDLAVRLAGHDRLDRGRQPFQDAHLLIRLRNYLVHYRPHSIGVDTPHKLGVALEGKFEGNAFGSDPGNPWFPFQALGAGCAAWSWRTARSFTDHVAEALGIEFGYQRVTLGDPLPR